MQRIALKSISLEDSIIFAALSGDFNPLHCDPAIARRTLFGGCVAHGVHALLLALDAWAGAQGDNCQIAGCVARFQGPVPIGAEFHVVQQPGRCENSVLLSVVVNERVAQSIDVAFSRGAARGSVVASDSPCFSLSGPKDRSFAEAASVSGSTPAVVNLAVFVARFPALAAAGLQDFAAAVLAATRVAGMECPGYNSIFSRFDYAQDGAGSCGANYVYRVRTADERLAKLVLDMDGAGAHVAITAHYRPPPVRQTAFADLQACVPAGVFRSQAAVVVGGSRGVGEVTAKLLAAGGADVCLTYLSGKSDAEAVCRDIADGGGSAYAAQFDLAASTLSEDRFKSGFHPSHIYLCASPAIRAKRSAEWDQDLFLRYFAAYGAEAIAAVRVISKATGTPLERMSIFIPSSVFASDPPVAFAEYAAAKAAAEVMWRAFARAHAGMAVHIARLPKMRTDQTNGFSGAAGALPEDVLLPHLLALSGSQSQPTNRPSSIERLAS